MVKCSKCGKDIEDKSWNVKAQMFTEDIPIRIKEIEEKLKEIHAYCNECCDENGDCNPDCEVNFRIMDLEEELEKLK